jgi:2'-5' RNA ligase
MMTNPKSLFFIALLLPEHISTVATKIKQHFAEFYNSKAALKSPPHITLQPPFPWNLEQLPALENKLKLFAEKQTTIPLTLNGFAAFKPRVIYINVLKNPELVRLYQDLREELEASFNLVDKAGKNRSFTPHLTVASKDLTKENFDQAWQEFREKKLYFNFTINQITLLKHNGKFWDIYKQYLSQNFSQ